MSGFFKTGSVNKRFGGWLKSSDWLGLQHSVKTLESNLTQRQVHHKSSLIKLQAEALLAQPVAQLDHIDQKMLHPTAQFVELPV